MVPVVGGGGATRWGRWVLREKGTGGRERVKGGGGRKRVTYMTSPEARI